MNPAKLLQYVFAHLKLRSIRWPDGSRVKVGDRVQWPYHWPYNDGRDIEGCMMPDYLHGRVTIQDNYGTIKPMIIWDNLFVNIDYEKDGAGHFATYIEDKRQCCRDRFDGYWITDMGLEKEER